MSSLICCEDVSKRFYPGPTEAVADLTLSVGEGEVLTLLGPSGCGKTTTLRLIAGFERPDAGTIRIAGVPVAAASRGGHAGSWVPPERRGVGMVFQDYALFPHLTVAENVAMGVSRMARGERDRRVQEVLRLVGLARLADRYPHELSGGQQQRVALARAIAPRPVVVLLDEPFSNLDAHLRATMRDEVMDIIRREGVTAICVTHDQKDALAVSDRVAVMNRGRLEQVGTPREIYQHPASVFVATFIGRSNLLEGVVTGPDGCVLTDFGSVCRVERTGMPVGSPVLVAVRPDSFLLDREGALCGVLESATFAGSTVEALVALETRDGSKKRVWVHLPPHLGAGAGDRLRFSLTPEFVSVVRHACGPDGIPAAVAGD